MKCKQRKYTISILYSLQSLRTGFFLSMIFQSLSKLNDILLLFIFDEDSFEPTGKIILIHRRQYWEKNCKLKTLTKWNEMSVFFEHMRWQFHRHWDENRTKITALRSEIRQSINLFRLLLSLSQFASFTTHSFHLYLCKLRTHPNSCTNGMCIENLWTKL